MKSCALQFAMCVTLLTIVVGAIFGVSSVWGVPGMYTSPIYLFSIGGAGDWAGNVASAIVMGNFGFLQRQLSGFFFPSLFLMALLFLLSFAHFFFARAVKNALSPRGGAAADYAALLVSCLVLWVIFGVALGVYSSFRFGHPPGSQMFTILFASFAHFVFVYLACGGFLVRRTA